MFRGKITTSRARGWWLWFILIRYRNDTGRTAPGPPRQATPRAYGAARGTAVHWVPLPKTEMANAGYASRRPDWRAGVVRDPCGTRAGGRLHRRTADLRARHDRVRYLHGFHDRTRRSREAAVAQRLAAYRRVPLPPRYPRDRLAGPASGGRHGDLRFDRLPAGRHAV